VKPQFEVGRERLGAGGVVRDPGLRADAVLTVARAGVTLGLTVRAVVASPLPGPGGNVEYFLWMTAPATTGGDAAVGGDGQDVPRSGVPGAADLREVVHAAVAAGPTGEGSTWTSGGGR
jgi:23S rRNA (cytidine1920-2'-O)/16S rRNA (cytidine1409-2'-O)-methyltransferase